MSDNPEWLSVQETSKNKRWSIGGLRWLIFNAENNGFSKCLRRIGSKILINQIEFDRWIDKEGKPRKRES